MSAPDPIERLGLKLFDAAREEPVPEDAMARVLDAARARQLAPVPRLSRAVKWSLLGAAAALAAGTALLVGRHESAERISAEPSSALMRGPHEVGTAAPEPAPSALARMAPSVAPPTRANAPSASPLHSAAQVSLSDELDALKVASSALSAGDNQGALAALDRYDHVLKGTKMRAEASLLRIEALSRSGQTQAASVLAQQFVDKNPESPLADRARSFVKQ